jgi:hypothetical protein
LATFHPAGRYEIDNGMQMAPMYPDQTTGDTRRQSAAPAWAYRQLEAIMGARPCINEIDFSSSEVLISMILIIDAAG